jgi:hypothetical protein
LAPDPLFAKTSISQKEEKVTSKIFFSKTSKTEIRPKINSKLDFDLDIMPLMSLIN